MVQADSILLMGNILDLICALGLDLESVATMLV